MTKIAPTPRQFRLWSVNMPGNVHQTVDTINKHLPHCSEHVLSIEYSPPMTNSIAIFRIPWQEESSWWAWDELYKYSGRSIVEDHWMHKKEWLNWGAPS